MALPPNSEVSRMRAFETETMNAVPGFGKQRIVEATTRQLSALSEMFHRNAIGVRAHADGVGVKRTQPCRRTISLIQMGAKGEVQPFEQG